MSEPTAKSQPARSHRLKILLILIAFAATGIWGISTRIEAAAHLRDQTNHQDIPTVAVITATGETSGEDIVLPGTVQAWHEAPIYARTSGYLKDWVNDIGTPVKAGDILAEIETPEIDAELHQAEADLATAAANNVLAQSTAKRWTALLKTNAVAKQDADEKLGDAAAKDALEASARANLDRLHQMEDFKRVVAPFDGIITARNTDTGALINAGSNGTGPELFHIAETDKLRVYVQVPELYASAVTPDLKAELHFSEYPQRVFPAELLHSADALDTVTRSLLIELAVNNDKNELLPGSYVEVHMRTATDASKVHIPVNTLLFRAEGLQVATVKDGKAHLVTITIGRDYGKDVEVTSGLTGGDQVIANPPDSLAEGQEVHVAPTPDAIPPHGDKKP